MKKILNPRLLPLIAVIMSLCGMALRFWTLGSGPDAAGLYPRQTAAWIVLWLFTAVAVILLRLITGRLKKTGTYEQSYPASILGAVGILAGAVALTYTGVQAFLARTALLDVFAAVLGVAAGVALAVAAYARMKGTKPSPVCHGIACLYMAVRVFVQCRQWSNVTQTGVFVFPLLAGLVTMITLYQRTLFDVELGQRRSMAFWSLTCVYLCLLAVPGNRDALIYVAVAFWNMADLCCLLPLKQKAVPEETPAEPVMDIDIDPPKTVKPEDMTMDELQDWLEN